VLTPTLDFHAFIGVGLVVHPIGVCANADVVVVSEVGDCRVSVFTRYDGTLLHSFGCHGSGDGQLNAPCALCFTADRRHVAVAESLNHRVSVFGVDGTFVRHVGVGVLRRPQGVACSTDDDLVVADASNKRVVVFSASGEPLKTIGDRKYSAVAVHGGTVFAQDSDAQQCVVLE
jgi:DNA-binding beta-propeller fold protein YncE